MCPYVPCKDYPECNHIKKIINYSHDWEGKFKKAFPNELEDEKCFCTDYGCRDIFRDLKQDIIKQAKQEVFDDIERNNIYQEHESCIAIDKQTLKKLKERHLSTFKTEK